MMYRGDHVRLARVMIGLALPQARSGLRDTRAFKACTAFAASGKHHALGYACAIPKS